LDAFVYPSPLPQYRRPFQSCSMSIANTARRRPAVSFA
jgi:hypothetical protein